MTDTTKPDTIDEALYDYGTQFISHPASRGIHDIEEAGTIMLAARGSLLRLQAENEALRKAYWKMRNAAAGYSNYCEESASTRRCEREYTEAEEMFRAAMKGQP